MIETPRLILRKFRNDDLDAMSELMGNAAFMRFSSGIFSRDKTAAFLKKIMTWDDEETPSLFAVITPAENKLIGYCGFFSQIVDDVAEIEIGYRLHPDWWGHGLATEAARAVRDHGFAQWRLGRMISLIHPDNIASRRVAEKTGMAIEKKTLLGGMPTLVFAIERKTDISRSVAKDAA